MAGYDVIVIGAGHNGLVAAAFLARAGKRVVVLEQLGQPGGTLATDEIAPGVRAPAAFATADLLHPSVVTELGLTGHGLRLLRSEGPTLMLRPGERPLAIASGNPEAAAAGLSTNDGAAYLELERLLGRIVTALDPVLTGPLPDIEPTGLGDLLELLTLGWRLRRLGRTDMPEALRLLPMELRDLAQERFEDETFRAAIVFSGLLASWLGPFSPGGVLSLLLHRPAHRQGLFDAPVFVAGGPGSLGQALAASARTAGAELRFDSPVATIRAADDGVTGIVLESGEEVGARRVVSAVDPRSTLVRLLERGWLEPDVLGAVQNIRMRGTVSIVRFVLEALPDFGVPHEALAGRVRLGPSLVYLERAFDNAKYGTMPEHPMLELTFPELTDTSLCVDGQHLMHAWVQYTPYALREGAWQDRRDELVQTVVRAVESCAPGFSSRVRHADVISPLDIETRWGLTGGHLYHGEIALDQVLYLRPFPGRYDYRTPVPGLYLCGPGCHPAGAASGLPGKNAANRVLADWATS